MKIRHRKHLIVQRLAQRIARRRRVAIKVGALVAISCELLASSQPIEMVLRQAAG